MTQAGFSLLCNRGGIYYLRRAIPKPLRAMIGKRELLV
jgi:hypothetical protein